MDNLDRPREAVGSDWRPLGEAELDAILLDRLRGAERMVDRDLDRELQGDDSNMSLVSLSIPSMSFIMAAEDDETPGICMS